MAKSQEIAQIEEINKGLTSLNTTLNTTATNYLTLVKTIADGSKAIKDNAVSFDNLSKAQKQTTDNAKQLDAANKQTATSEKKLNDLQKGALDDYLKNQIAIQKLTKAKKDKIAAEGLEEGSLVKMRMRLKELTTAYDQAGTRTKAAAKEIDLLSREIGKAETATNRHGRGVGGYADQLGKLPGPIGQAATAAGGLGKQLWALVANPIVATIAGIVLVVTALFKAFKSTDEGGVKLAGVFKGLKNVVDVLMDRLVSFGKLIWAIIRLDFEDIKKNGKDAFGGLTKQLEETFKAGETYAKTMDNIKDRQAAAAGRAALLRNEIEKLKNQMRMKVGEDGFIQSAAKRIELSEILMAKEYELLELEKGFAKETTAAEVKNLASKIQIDGLTIESKEAMLEKWLAINDKQLDSELKKDAAFANFYNKNEEAIQTLQKMKADDIAMDGDFEKETRRIQIGAATFKKEVIDDIIKAQEEAAKTQIDLADATNSKELSLIKKRHIDGLSSEDQYNAELEAQEIIFLNKKLTFYKAGSKEYEDIQVQIQEKQIKAGDRTKELLLKSQKELFDARAANIKDENEREISIEKQKYEDEKTALQKGLIIKDKLSVEEIAINENINNTIIEKQEALVLKIDEINKKASDGKLKDLDDFKKKYKISQADSLDEEIKLFENSKEYALLTEEEKQKGLKEIKEKYGKEDKERAAELRDLEFELASQAINGIFDLGSMKRDEELSALDKERERKLSNKKLTEAQKLKIDEEYDKKAAAIKTKQAKADKLQALFNIALNTAVASMATLSKTPLPAGAVLLALTIALGAIQAGLVVAQPIPKYAKGTKDAPLSGIFGEAGRELMFLKSGDIAMAEKATYFEGSKFKGAQIFSNPETEKMISMTEHLGYSGRTTTDDRLLSELKLTRKAIMEKPVAIFDKENRMIGHKTSHSQTIYLNRLLHRN